MSDRKIKYAERQVDTDFATYCLMYELLVDEITFYNTMLELYGVGVRSESDETVQDCEVHAVTSSGRKVYNILEQLTDGSVFPGELEEILENIL